METKEILNETTTDVKKDATSETVTDVKKDVTAQAAPEVKKETAPEVTFDSLNLSEAMKKTVSALGFVKPTPIQVQTIPQLLEGGDMIGQAQTGTGKTAAFGIPTIEKIVVDERTTQGLIICPTRELAVQVGEELKKLSGHLRGLSVITLYGGQPIEKQIRPLARKTPHIIVATPGRLCDHINRKTVSLKDVRMLVLDEADKMLDMGFRDEIEMILEKIPSGRQRMFFSATMPAEIMEMAYTYLRDPKVVRVARKDLTVAKIDQSYYPVHAKEKVDILCRVIDYYKPKVAVAFCNTKRKVDDIVDRLVRRGFRAAGLHGDMKQGSRDRVMEKFRSGDFQVLIATDVAARGLDVDNVELVFNYHLPHDPEDYVHRIGRTGRAGRKGRAVSCVEPGEMNRLKAIMRFAKTDIQEMYPPSEEDVQNVRFEAFFEKIAKVLTAKNIDRYKDIITAREEDPALLAAAMLKLAIEQKNETTKRARSSEGRRSSDGRRSNDGRRSSSPRGGRSGGPRRGSDSRRGSFGGRRRSNSEGDGGGYNRDGQGRDDKRRGGYNRDNQGRDGQSRDGQSRGGYNRDSQGRDTQGGSDSRPSRSRGPRSDNRSRNDRGGKGNSSDRRGPRKDSGDGFNPYSASSYFID